MDKKKGSEHEQLKRLELYEIRELKDLIVQVDTLIRNDRILLQKMQDLEKKQDLILLQQKEIIRLLEALQPNDTAVRDLVLTEEKSNMGKIIGLHPNETKVYNLSFIPPNGELAPGTIPSYTQDNTTDVGLVQPALDGMKFSVTASGTFQATSFNVTASVMTVNPDGTPNLTPVTRTFNIPLLPPEGTAVPITDLDLAEEGAEVAPPGNGGGTSPGRPSTGPVSPTPKR